MKIGKLTLINPSDILIVDFGSSTIKSHVKGRHPAIVVNVDNPRALNSRIMVIPIFRNPSYHGGDTDIEIKPLHCNGLRYTEYANPSNIQVVERYRVIRKIGHMKNADTRERLNRALAETMFGGKAGENDG